MDKIQKYFYDILKDMDYSEIDYDKILSRGFYQFPDVNEDELANALDFAGSKLFYKDRGKEMNYKFNESKFNRLYNKITNIFLEAKLGKCLRKSLELIGKDKSLKLMMGPSGNSDDTAHFWVVTPDGKVIDKASDRVDKDYEYKGREVNPENVKKELNETKRFRVPDDIREINVQRNLEIAKEHDVETSGEFMKLYHGTSNSNVKKINKSNRFNQWTWFAEDIDTAKLYATRNHGEKSTVLTVWVYAGSILGGSDGYWSSQEDLYNENDRYMPKDILGTF